MLFVPLFCFLFRFLITFFSSFLCEQRKEAKEKLYTC